MERPGDGVEAVNRYTSRQVKTSEICKALGSFCFNYVVARAKPEAIFSRHVILSDRWLSSPVFVGAYRNRGTEGSRTRRTRPFATLRVTCYLSCSSNSSTSLSLL